MRRNSGPVATAVALLLAAATVLTAAPAASAQDTDEIVGELESRGYYIEPGAEATDAEMRSLVSQGERTPDQWYFVVLSGPGDVNYAADLRDLVRPVGNVLVHSVDEDSQGAFDVVDFASGASASIEQRALAAFDGTWDRPADYFEDVVSDYTTLTAAGTVGTTSGEPTGDSSGGGFPWGLVAIPVVIGGGIWLLSRRGKKKKAQSDLETARKIRTELQAELDELANDVLVLSGPVDVCDKPEAIQHYREATDTYLTISDEIPDLDELEQADLAELSQVGVRVAHARWQMDAAEAIIDGEPIPEKPQVEPPPPPTPAPTRTIEQQRRQLPQRQPRPRVPYSRSRGRSGGGLLDILIAGGGVVASSRGRRPTRSSARTASRSTPRAGGGVFGGGSGRSSSRSSTRSTRRSSGSRSTSKRRRR